MYRAVPQGGDARRHKRIFRDRGNIKHIRIRFLLDVRRLRDINTCTLFLPRTSSGRGVRSTVVPNAAHTPSHNPSLCHDPPSKFFYFRNI